MLVIKWSSGPSRSSYNKEHNLLNRKHIKFILSILYHIIFVVRLRLYYIKILYSFIICSLMFRSLKKAMLILLCLQYFTFTLTHLLHTYYQPTTLVIYLYIKFSRENLQTSFYKILQLFKIFIVICTLC